MPRGGRAIGWFPDNPVEEVVLQLSPGDMLVYYTDGLTEAENSAGDYYGEDRLAQVIIAAAEQPIDAVVAHIVAEVERFADGEPLFDDLTLVVVRFTGQSED